jgi:hypothetical protein
LAVQPPLGEKSSPAPWTWLIVNTFLRLFELFLAATMSYAVGSSYQRSTHTRILVSRCDDTVNTPPWIDWWLSNNINLIHIHSCWKIPFFGWDMNLSHKSGARQAGCLTCFRDRYWVLTRHIFIWIQFLFSYCRCQHYFQRLVKLCYPHNLVLKFFVTISNPTL